MRESFVCKLPLENIPDDTVTVFSLWEESSFSLKVIHRGNAWEKKISSDDVKSMSSGTPLQPMDYISEAKRALAGGEGIKDFTYSFVGAEITWKKLCEDMKVKYGCVLLEKASLSDVIDSLIEFMMHQKVALEKKTKDLERENSRLKLVNSGLRTEVDKLVSSKNEFEETLYSKFTCLLNAKKEKIEILEKELGKGKQKKNSNGAEEIDSSENDKEMESGDENAEALKEKRDEYGSETEKDTDEEDIAPSSSKIRRIASPVIAPHNTDFEDISEDSSSNFGNQRRMSEEMKKEARKSSGNRSPVQSLLQNPRKYSTEDILNDM